MINNNGIYKIKKNKKNNDIVNKYIINGSENNVCLELEKDETDNILQAEKKFGIVTYDKEFIYGNKKNIPINLNDVKEPIRILMNKNLYDIYITHIKKLIIINTENDNYIHVSFDKLIKDFKYDVIYTKYDSLDLQNRYLPLPGKFNDAKTVYQNIEQNNLLISNLTNIEKNLYEWYIEYINILYDIKLDFQKTLNKIFNNNDEYYFQKNNPLRFSINNNIGTPMHIDTCSKVYDSSNNDKKKTKK